MKSIGSFLALMGAGSFVLNLIGFEFKLLFWIDLWGPTIGNLIRIVLIVIGLALLLIGAALEKTSTKKQPDALAK